MTPGDDKTAAPKAAASRATQADHHVPARVSLRRIPPAVIVASASALAAGTAFFVNVLSARSLGPAFRGEVALVLQVAYFLVPLLMLGTDRIALIRRGRSPTLSLPLLASSTVVAAGLMAVFASNYLWIAVPIALANVFLGLRRASTLSGGGTRTFVIPFACYQVFIALSSLILWQQSINQWPIWAAVYAMPVVFLTPLSLLSTHGWALPQWRSHAWITTSQLSQLVTTRAQRLLLPGFAGPHELGLFIVVATATEPLFWLAQALADQRVGFGSDTPDSTTSSLARRIARETMLFGVLGITGGVLLYLIIPPVFGEDFAAAQPLVLPLTLSGVSLAIYRQIAGWVMASRSPATYALIETLNAAMACAIYIPFVISAGARGAAWASLGAYTVAGAMTAAVYLRSSTT